MAHTPIWNPCCQHESWCRGQHTPCLNTRSGEPAFDDRVVARRERRLCDQPLSGLRNNGNTCFMNSLVQCLFYSNLLRRYILHSLPDDEQHERYCPRARALRMRQKRRHGERNGVQRAHLKDVEAEEKLRWYATEQARNLGATQSRFYYKYNQRGYNNSGPKPLPFCPLCAMHSVFYNMVMHEPQTECSHEGDEAPEPWPLTDNLTEFHPTMQHGRQHDSHEFLRHALDRMQQALRPASLRHRALRFTPGCQGACLGDFGRRLRELGIEDYYKQQQQKQNKQGKNTPVPRHRIEGQFVCHPLSIRQADSESTELQVNSCGSFEETRWKYTEWLCGLATAHLERNGLAKGMAGEWERGSDGNGSDKQQEERVGEKCVGRHGDPAKRAEGCVERAKRADGKMESTKENGENKKERKEKEKRKVNDEGSGKGGKDGKEEGTGGMSEHACKEGTAGGFNRSQAPISSIRKAMAILAEPAIRLQTALRRVCALRRLRNTLVERRRRRLLKSCMALRCCDREPHTLERLFAGRLRSRITCTAPGCGAVSDTFDMFEDLSLEISDPSINTLSDALRHFTARERLCEGNEYCCETCKRMSKATKEIDIRQWPELLCIHFKRFAGGGSHGVGRVSSIFGGYGGSSFLGGGGGYGYGKEGKVVEFYDQFKVWNFRAQRRAKNGEGGKDRGQRKENANGTKGKVTRNGESQREAEQEGPTAGNGVENVQIANGKACGKGDATTTRGNYSIGIPKGIRKKEKRQGHVKADIGGELVYYRLYAMVVHNGYCLSSGHYYAFCKSFDRSTWLELNDSMASIASSRFQNAPTRVAAYMLFYERLSEPPSSSRERAQYPLLYDPFARSPITTASETTPSPSADVGASATNRFRGALSLSNPLSRKGTKRRRVGERKEAFRPLIGPLLPGGKRKASSDGGSVNTSATATATATVQEVGINVGGGGRGGSGSNVGGRQALSLFAEHVDDDDDVSLSELSSDIDDSFLGPVRRRGGMFLKVAESLFSGGGGCSLFSLSQASLPLFLSLSLSLSSSLSFSLSLFLSPSLCLCVSVCLSLSLSFFVSFIHSSILSLLLFFFLSSLSLP